MHDINSEDASGGWDEGDFADSGRKGGEELLGELERKG